MSRDPFTDRLNAMVGGAIARYQEREYDRRQAAIELASQREAEIVDEDGNTKVVTVRKAMVFRTHKRVVSGEQLALPLMGIGG